MSSLLACSLLIHSCAITSFHFSIGCRGEEFCWRHCLGYLRDSSLALIISLWPLFCTLKRRSIGRSCWERMLFHYSSRDCYARFWSTWDTHQTLSWTRASRDSTSIAARGAITDWDTNYMRAPAPAVPSTEPIPEVAPSAPHATPRTPLVIPPISEPSPSSEPRITISISDYRGLCHTLQALATS